jgi:hypothetical protein
MLGAVATPAAAAAEGGWSTQKVANAVHADDYSGTRTAIDVGRSGRVSIMYVPGPNDVGGFNLRVARGPGAEGKFERERIDPDDDEVVGSASYVVGRRGREYASYVTGLLFDQGRLKVATRTRTSGWSDVVVDGDPSVSVTAITLDGKRPVVAYSKIGNELRIATGKHGQWSTSPVAGSRAMAVDVAIGADGHPMIAYVVWDGSAYVARLMDFDGSFWIAESIGHVATQGIEFGIDLVVGADGVAEAVYPVLEPSRGLMSARRTGSGWETEPIDTGDIWQPAAALDPAGDLHVTYYDADDGALMHAERALDSWLVETIADNSSPTVRIGRQSSLAIARDGGLHVAYYVGDATTGTTVRYARSS